MCVCVRERYRERERKRDRLTASVAGACTDRGVCQANG